MKERRAVAVSARDGGTRSPVLSTCFAEELKFLQEMSAGSVRVTGGEQFGEDMAVVKIAGDTAGEKFTGEVTMKKGSRGWYVDKESRKY